MSSKNSAQNSLLFDLMVQQTEGLGREFEQRLLVETGVKLSKAQVLFMSYLEDGVDRSSTMVKKLHITRQAVSLLVKELESKGVIKQISDPDKGSAKLIVKTEYGMAFVTTAMDIMATLEAEIANKIGKKEFSTLKKTLSQRWV